MRQRHVADKHCMHGHTAVGAGMQEEEQAEARPASAFRTGRTVLEAERRRKGLPAAADDEAPNKGGRRPGATDLGSACTAGSRNGSEGFSPPSSSSTLY